MTPTDNIASLETGGAAARTASTDDDAHRPRCLGCGYDLRGHSPRALCPECGLHVAVSLAARRSAAPPVHPLWRRQLIESAAVSLAAFGVQFAALYLVRPVSGRYGYVATEGSAVIVAGLAAVLGWTLLWLSTLKLALAVRYEAPSPAGVGRAVVLCLVATVYGALPVWAFLTESGFTPLASYVAQFVWLCAPPAAGAAYFLRLGAVFRRLGAPGPAAQARLLAVLIPFALVRHNIAGDDGSGPLGLFARMPNYQHGSQGAWIAELRYLESASFLELIYSVLPLAVNACGTYLVVRLWVTAFRATPVPATPVGGEAGAAAPIGRQCLGRSG